MYSISFYSKVPLNWRLDRTISRGCCLKWPRRRPWHLFLLIWVPTTSFPKILKSLAKKKKLTEISNMNKKLLPPHPPTLTLSIVIIVSYISPYFTNCWAIGKKDDDDILSIIAPNNMEYTHTHTQSYINQPNWHYIAGCSFRSSRKKCVAIWFTIKERCGRRRLDSSIIHDTIPMARHHECLLHTMNRFHSRGTMSRKLYLYLYIAAASKDKEENQFQIMNSWVNKWPCRRRL